jgi:hypothetical protein
MRKNNAFPKAILGEIKAEMAKPHITASASKAMRSGQPMTAHWGVPDPAAVAGSPEQIERAFRDSFMILDRRISLLLCLPLSSLDKLAIQKEIDRIGHQ